MRKGDVCVLGMPMHSSVRVLYCVYGFCVCTVYVYVCLCVSKLIYSVTKGLNNTKSNKMQSKRICNALVLTNIVE